jgi:hypothetical protein
MRPKQIGKVFLKVREQPEIEARSCAGPVQGAIIRDRFDGPRNDGWVIVETEVGTAYEVDDFAGAVLAVANMNEASFTDLALSPITPASNAREKMGSAVFIIRWVFRVDRGLAAAA